MALLQNAHVSVLKLGYNNLGDEGTSILAAGIAQHPALELLDLGFNDIGDDGCHSLASAIPSHGSLHTLYLAGNLIGEDGAVSIADLIRRRTTALRKLYMSGNKIGPGGVKAIVDAFLEMESTECEHHEEKVNEDSSSEGNRSRIPRGGVQELFLGGTGMGVEGCLAVTRFLSRTTTLKVLSLPNCDLEDDSIEHLAQSIKTYRDQMVLESLQLSFNRISCKGIEHLTNAIRGLGTLKELGLDNNRIADVGAHQIATVLPTLPAIDTLDLGFNNIKTRGMMSLMKAVANCNTLKTLSVSGNMVDTNGAKAITYALAYSQSLTTVSLVRCDIKPEGQRQIVAGIVSNSRTSLRAVSGFLIGPVVVMLGFPAPIEHWNNEQVFNFIHLMWSNHGSEVISAEEEKNSDPLHFLEGTEHTKPAPLEAGIVVEVARKTFASLVEEGVDVFSRHQRNHEESSESSTPILYESVSLSSTQPETINGSSVIKSSLVSHQKNMSFVVPPVISKPTTPDPARKKRIVEWLCRNIPHLNKIAQQPFSSSELGRLHQHYFSPVINESGGCMGVSSIPSSDMTNESASSCEGMSIASSAIPLDTFVDSIGGSIHRSNRDSTNASPAGIASLPMLKRKVSYRCLGEAALASAPKLESGRRHPYGIPTTGPVTMLIEGGPVGNTLPRTSKRARRNRSRISFLPRIKTKLDSYLDVCHEKALTMMRQLYYVERAILAGQVNPINPARHARTHLCGDFALDAEMIIVDMI